MNFDVYLSVIIPTYKEARRLPQTLEEILPYLTANFREFEIVVVDDNSPDGTGQIVQDYGRRHPMIRLLTQPGKIGKGAAVRRGCMEAKGELILFMDADHSTPIQDIAAFIPHLISERVGAVAGVRTYQEDESRSRRIIGLCAQLIAHLIVFRKAVVDSQCGFKLFTPQTAAALFPYCRVNGGMLDAELFYLMHKKNIPCHFEPVHWANKPGSRINVVACMIFDPIDMVRIRMRDFVGVYANPLPAARQPWFNQST